MKDRIKIVQELLEKDRLGAFLVSSNLNIRYLTGFEGTAGFLLILKDRVFLLVDSRYTLKARRGSRGVEVITVINYLDALSILLNKRKIIRMGFEEEHLNYRDFRRLTFLLPGVRLYPYARFIEKQRACKERGEIFLIKKSIAITEKALSDLSCFMRPGMSEKELADKLEEDLRRYGAKGSNFRTMVAIPENASLPHSEPGRDVIPSRGLVLVDVGCNYEGYNSDLTRMFLLDKMNSSERRFIEIVIKSQRKAMEAVRIGVFAREIDRIGRGVIEGRGLGKYFGHGLGHGIGLGVHEEPAISKESSSVLEEGMVFTIEPGIYLPGRIGVRIEDIIVVKREGGVKLTNLPAVLKVKRYCQGCKV